MSVDIQTNNSDFTTQLTGVLIALAEGRLILITDDLGVRKTSYLVGCASNISVELVAKMVNIARGLVCVSLSEDRVRELGLPLMGQRSSSNAPDFTTSVEARQGVSTGISAADRARTLHTIATTNDPKADLVMPGHIFPMVAKRGGVLVKSSISEASLDLLNIAQLPQAAAICACLNEKGDLISEYELKILIEENKLFHLSISDIIRYRLSSEPIIEKIAEASLPTKFAGEFQAFCFRSKIDDAEHLALVKGNITECNASGEQIPVLARVQAENRLGDLLGSETLASQTIITGALRKINEVGRGIFVYVRHPRKGALREQVQALSKQDTLRKHPHQLREYGIGAQILLSLGAKRICLLSNSDRDVAGSQAFQLEIVDRQRFQAYPGKIIC